MLGLSRFVADLLVFLGLFQTYPALGVLGALPDEVRAQVSVGRRQTLGIRVRLNPTSKGEIIGDAMPAETEAAVGDAVYSVPTETMDARREEKFSAAILTAFILLVWLFPGHSCMSSTEA